ncbi:YrrS family protein [Alkalihalobacillus pseudalcaliphilus]|uniref:YrrS family protein n=1 Tax=Alkalihalobacillus pseudalcaliphilus TaxID=79884 RepID=UPI00064D9223|nr:YrrS family protein [Alkalihalobacillus pseudalcaliphilus]KMK75752.1 hypothetical protein AB990_10780 [Alkalihalobacillus pseudalcaliphilus]
MYESRRDSRKKQRLNRLLNIAIIIVIALIGVFAYQIFKPSNEMTTEEDSQEQLENEQLDGENVATEDDDADNGGTEEGLPEEEGKIEEDENQQEPDENENEKEEDAREEEDDLEPVEDGEWQPIGTEQSGAYSHDFNEGSLNWQEKVRALSYATGIPQDEMTVWWLGNGGSPHRVNGVVAGPDGQKYEVLMEFIEGEGWLPLEKSETN